MLLTSVLFTALFGAGSVTGLQSPHKKAVPKAGRYQPNTKRAASSPSEKAESSTYLNAKSAKFAVNGTAIPEVDFDIGESYAGTLPISNDADDENRLWFWFFPSENPAACEEIVIWLNGGPGCSSLDGLLQENGPFLWQSGTYAPIANPYSWVNLTNMVWIDQPIGTGFSPHAKGAPQKIVNEKDVAEDFMGFWKNFMETFDLVGRKVYITGESYAGQYIPYISYYMLMANDTDYYNVAGIQINDPSINEDDTMNEAPAVPMVNAYSDIFGLNHTTMTHLNERFEACGYAQFMDNALSYPPKGLIPTAPKSSRSDCDLWEQATEAAIYVNPCFNFYHIIDYCPYLWDVLGFPSLAGGPNNYFNRSDVQAAIHAPPTDYNVCGDDELGLNQYPHYDESIPSGLGPLPKVIEMTNNVVIGNGYLDFLLLTNGTLITIQNMTWNGKQGFQSPPTEQLYVPYHPGLAQDFDAIFFQPIPVPVITNVAGAGYLGATHHERGLTYVGVAHAGHEIPQYVPGAAFRTLEFLLGRIPNLTVKGDFTTQNGNYTGAYQPARPIGG